LQGAQWLGCGDELMCLPVYRRTVEATDAIFQRLAGERLQSKSRIGVAIVFRLTEAAGLKLISWF
jgi:hypothetical protein